jgi:hypothetical protein
MKEFGLIPHRSTHWPLVVMLPVFCPQIVPIVPVLPTLPTGNCCAVYHLRFELFHGMEEVVGSIPIRSTNSSISYGSWFRSVGPCAHLRRDARVVMTDEICISLYWHASKNERRMFSRLRVNRFLT